MNGERKNTGRYIHRDYRVYRILGMAGSREYQVFRTTPGMPIATIKSLAEAKACVDLDIEEEAHRLACIVYLDSLLRG